MPPEPPGESPSESPPESPSGSPSAAEAAAPPGPLDGLLVVDLTRLLPGPLAARLLADLGARVVKIEEPELGDPVRLAPPRVGGGTGALAARLLAGLESVALDLRHEPARAVLERLLARADVLLESFRPGTLARLGLDPERLAAEHPRLVVCSLSGWGQDGPHAGRAGHDLAYQAAAGTLASTAAVPNLPAADLLGAWSAVGAVLAALYRRRASGRGARVDASLFDAARHGNLTAEAAEAAGSHGVGERLQLTGALPCYELYRTRDGGVLAVAALERRFWRRFCAAAGRPELGALQYRTDAASRRRVAALVAERTREEWRQLCDRHDLPAEPVLTVAEAARHPQALERDQGRARGFPARIDGARPEARGPVPALGEHTRAILAEIGDPAAGSSVRDARRAGIGRRRTLRSILAERVGSPLG